MKVEDLQAHFGLSGCRPKDSNGCEICGSLCLSRQSKNLRKIKNIDKIDKSFENENDNDNKNDKMDYSQSQQDLKRDNELAIEKMECLERKVNFAFETMFALLKQLSNGEKLDIKEAAIQHNEGILTIAQEYKNENQRNKNYNNNLVGEKNKLENQDPVIYNNVHNASDLRVVARQNLVEVYDERNGTLIASHPFKSAVSSLAQYESRVKSSLINAHFLRLDLGRRIVELVDLWSPRDLFSFEVDDKVMKKVERLAEVDRVYEWIYENINRDNINSIQQMILGCDHAGVLMKNGKVMLAGKNDRGQIYLIANKNLNVKQISSKGLGTGLTYNDGSVHIFGMNNSNQFIVNKKVKQISLGVNHTGFLFEDSTIQFIGDNGFGQCIIPSRKTDIKQLDLGDRHT
eukprot:Mrub_01816.p1 GENE.Mrub_01816~~Mrub_01816.p1  ORF type:complete len:402 (-),score=40.33 Mrub_01816:368-1573(-)